MKATPLVLIVPHQKLPNSIKNSYILYEFLRKNGQFLSMSHIFSNIVIFLPKIYLNKKSIYSDSLPI